MPGSFSTCAQWQSKKNVKASCLINNKLPQTVEFILLIQSLSMNSNINSGPVLQHTCLTRRIKDNFGVFTLLMPSSQMPPGPPECAEAGFMTAASSRTHTVGDRRDPIGSGWGSVIWGRV